MTEFLTVDEIAQAQDLKTVDVEVPEWGGYVRFMEFSGPERLTLTEDRDAWETNCHAVALGMVDGENAKVYPDPDGSELTGKNPDVIGRLLQEVFKLNGMTSDSVGELEGNSGSGANAAPSSS